MRAHQFLAEDESSKFKKLARIFLPFVQKHLGINELPKVSFLNQPLEGTFGRYYDGTIRVVIAGRHPVDALRTLAHELVHWKQELEGEITQDAGDTGSPQENEANARAGIIMRDFDQAYPELLKNLRESADYVKTNVAYHNNLNSVAWRGTEMQPEVRQKLLQIAKVFVGYLEIPNFRVLDVVLTGSMANFNYTKYSDFDIHVVTEYKDLQCDDLAEAFYQAKKKIWNDDHNITIHGHEAELYVEDVDSPPVSSGVFSILRNKWVQQPSYKPPTVDDSSVNSKVKDLIKQIDAAIGSADDPADLERVRDKLYKMRRAGLDAAGEFSTENLAFKILRNLGYLDKLRTAYHHQQDTDLSL